MRVRRSKYSLLLLLLLYAHSVSHETSPALPLKQVFWSTDRAIQSVCVDFIAEAKPKVGTTALGSVNMQTCRLYRALDQTGLPSLCSISIDFVASACGLGMTVMRMSRAANIAWGGVKDLAAGPIPLNCYPALEISRGRGLESCSSL